MALNSQQNTQETQNKERQKNCFLKEQVEMQTYVNPS